MVATLFTGLLRNAMTGPNIHPTALVHPQAAIDQRADIGPYAVIGAGAVIGSETRVQAHAIIEGSVRLGTGNVIGYGAILGAPPQDLAFVPTRKSSVEIGDHNVIREYCTIHRGTTDGTATTVGDGNYLMAGAHLGHNCTIGNKVIIANNCLLGGYVTVADGAFLGGGCVFHQSIRVGRLAITQGGSGFSKDIPPFVIAAETNLVFGVNAVGLRRAGISATERAEIKKAFRLVYTSGMNVSQALTAAGQMSFGPSGQEFLAFVAEAKKRGICGYGGGPRAGDNVPG